jgi:hypothetical protein
MQLEYGYFKNTCISEKAFTKTHASQFTAFVNNIFDAKMNQRFILASNILLFVAHTGWATSIVPKASNPIFAGALTKTAKNLTNGPGGVPEGVANFVDTKSYQNGHFVRG